MPATATSTAEGSAFRWASGGVDSLVVFLRQRGFSIGPSEAIDAARLVLHLARQVPLAAPPVDAEWLAPKLRPIFCKNRADQERFDALFAEWAGVKPTYPSPGGEIPPTPPEMAPAPASTARSRWTTAVLVVLAAVIVFAVYERMTSSPSAPSAPTAPLEGAGRAQASATAAATATAPKPANERYYGVFPAVRYNPELRPWVGGGLLGLGALALLGLAIPLAVPWLGHSRRSGRPITLDDSSLRKEAERIVPPLSAEVSARLARHVAGPAALRHRLQRRPPLDVDRTIEATLRRLGVLQLRYRAARLTPSYLLLVDVVNEQDPRGRMFYHWAQRLRRQGIEVDIRLVRFDQQAGSARTARPADSEWRLNGVDGEPLDRLPPPPVGQRLIVVSDGDLLVDQHGCWRDWALRAGFHRWSDRAVFSPLEPRNWGVREEAIERPERSADAGFIILPLDEAALAAWAELVVSGRLPEFSLSRPQRYPRLLRAYEEQGLEDRLLANAPPFDRAAELADLIAQLKLYLGENGYYWLCACAVPPIIRWQFTLLLGEQYLLNAGVEEDDLPGFIARYYARLASLPWMRRQKMPDWLRLALLDSVPPLIQQEIRQVLRSRLGKLKPAAEGQQTLQLEEPPGPLGRRRKPAPADGAVLADTLYLGYMDGRTPRQLILRAPREWSDWLTRLPSRRRPGLFGDWLAALRDRLLWRNGLSFLGASRRAWSVFLLAVALLAGLGSWLVASDPEQLAPALRAALYLEQARAVAFPHRGPVQFAAFSPDGHRILTASSDHSARLWDAHSGRPLGEPMVHRGPVNAAAFSADGRRVVTASDDQTARLWDAETGQALGSPMRHQGAVFAATFSPDGRRVLTASADRTARLWDAASTEPLGEAMHHQDAVFDAAFRTDGRRVVTASADRTARLWDGASGKALGAAMRHQGMVRIAAFSPDGRRVLTASADQTARLWDGESGKPLGEAMQHLDVVFAAAFSPDGRRVVTASADHTARLWDGESGKPLGDAMRHQDAVADAAFSPDSRHVLTASSDRTARLWDAASGKPLGEAMRHQDAVYGAAFSPDGASVLTASADRTARRWDAGSDRLIGQPMLANGAVFDAIYSPDGRRVLTASGDRSARLWDAQSGSPLGQPMPHEGKVNRAAFSPDGRRVVTASDDYTAHLWDGQTGSPLGAAMRHQGAVHDAAFSPDGSRVLTASEDDTAHLWDGQSGSPVGVPMRHGAAVQTATFSRDGSLVVTASADQSARLWDAQSGLPRGQAMRHQAAVRDAEFNGDGSRVVTASDDWTARVWDVRTGSAVGEAMRHQGAVTRAEFSADGGRVVTASEDSTARLWDAASGASLGEPMRHQAPVASARFSPDGTRALTASADRTARLWDARSGLPLVEPMAHPGAVFDGAFSPEGGRVVTAWGSLATPRQQPTAAAAGPKNAPATKSPQLQPQPQKSLEILQQPQQQQQQQLEQMQPQPPPQLQRPSSNSAPRSSSAPAGRHAGALQALADFIPSAMANGRTAAAPAQTVAQTAPQAVQTNAGGALMWRAAPSPLPVPEASVAASSGLVATLSFSALAAFAALALAMGGRTRRRLAALSRAEAQGSR